MAMMRNGEMEKCIQECVQCLRVCEETSMHCLDKGGKHAEKSNIRLMIDCAEICETSANFMMRNSDAHGEVCGVCADVCQKCADDCRQFSDDPEMLKCADVCSSCEESCRRMAMS